MSLSVHPPISNFICLCSSSGMLSLESSLLVLLPPYFALPSEPSPLKPTEAPGSVSLDNVCLNHPIWCKVNSLAFESLHPLLSQQLSTGQEPFAEPLLRQPWGQEPGTRG